MNYSNNGYKKQMEIDENSLDNRNFERWMNNNIVIKDNPVVIGNSFRNLSDPLSYIRDDRIAYLQQQTQVLKEKRMSQRQAIVDMNKATYQKVLSRAKVDYRFGSSFVDKNRRDERVLKEQKE